MQIQTFLTFLLLASLPLAARTWTSKDGKTISADLVSFVGNTVTLQLSNGQQVPVAMEKLCPDDIAFLKRKADLEDSGIDNPDKWPEIIPGPKDFKLKEVKARKDNAGKTIYQTKHFKFVCDTPLADDAQEAVGKLYECTWTAIRAMPLPITRVR
ncbi:MAG: SHD1 domain-containing protein, partial [Verrucomicrobia bacterium]|nr:SHD1 domain-containing protein [Verrucomicrobiota bacterium]